MKAWGAGVVACAVGVAACGGWLPAPPFTDHGGEEPILVGVAPPPARVEIIPEQPKEPPDTVWIDGQWMWRGRRWEWEPGRWEVTPAGAAYARPEIVYLEHDRIGWLPGRWRLKERRAR